MNKKQIALAVVLADFSAFTAYAVYTHGLVGVFETILSTIPGWLVMTDLTIALSLCLTWMWNDARERGASFLPYAVLTLGLGSVGPLLYLIVRAGQATETATATATHASPRASALGVS